MTTLRTIPCAQKILYLLPFIAQDNGFVHALMNFFFVADITRINRITQQMM